MRREFDELSLVDYQPAEGVLDNQQHSIQSHGLMHPHIKSNHSQLWSVIVKVKQHLTKTLDCSSSYIYTGRLKNL